MKSLTLRSSVALACALSLYACGGSSGNLLLGGRIDGLTKPGLQLQNKSGPVLEVLAGAPNFTFKELIGNDEDFDVQVKTNPVGATCVPTNNKGKSGAYSVTSVVITCTNTTTLLLLFLFVLLAAAVPAADAGTDAAAAAGWQGQSRSSRWFYTLDNVPLNDGCGRWCRFHASGDNYQGDYNRQRR